MHRFRCIELPGRGAADRDLALLLVREVGVVQGAAVGAGARGDVLAVHGRLDAVLLAGGAAVVAVPARPADAPRLDAGDGLARGRHDVEIVGDRRGDDVEIVAV